MAEKRQIRQTRWTRRWQTLLAAGSFGLAMALLTGCSHTPSTAQQNYDPLTGVRTPPGSPIPPAPQPTPVNANQPHANNQGMPAIPTTLSATNTATIAGTSWQTPASLAINDRPAPIRLGTPGQLTSDAKTQQTPAMPGFPAANPRPHVEEIPDARPAGQNLSSASNWQVPPGTIPATQTGYAASADDAVTKQLQDRGVINQKRDPVPEGIHLTCYVSQNGGGVSIYEVTAADYPAAARLMLDQLPR